MWRAASALLVTFPAFVLAAIGTSCGREKGDLAVSIGLATSTTNTCLLRVVVENIGSSTLLIERSQAPWEFNAGNVYIALFEVDGLRRHSIERSPHSINKPVGEVRIPRGRSITNEIALDFYFESLPTILRRSDVMMLWLYEPVMAQTQHHMNPVSGYLRIQQIHTK
jgi:hypothetical protein